MLVNTEPEIHNLIICGNIFVRKEGKYLMMRRSPVINFLAGLVHPFGGKAQLNENPLAAAQRELWEETGLKVKNTRLEAVILEIAPIKNKPENWLIFHFSADYDSGQLVETDEGKAIWLSLEEIKKQKMFPSVAKVIDNILNPEDGTIFATFEYSEDKTEIVESKVDICVKGDPDY